MGPVAGRIMRKITFPLVIPAIAFRIYHDIFQNDGYIWRTKYSRYARPVLHHCYNDPR